MLQVEPRLQIYADRLLKEWTSYGKIIIGCDYDSTISPYQTLANNSDIERTIKLLRECKLTGCYIVIHTACREDRYDEIKKYCESVGLDVDTINRTPIDLPYGNEGSKPYCNHFLDDRAALPLSLDVLEYALYKTRAHIDSKKHLDDVA